MILFSIFYCVLIVGAYYAGVNAERCRVHRIIEEHEMIHKAKGGK